VRGRLLDELRDELQRHGYAARLRPDVRLRERYRESLLLRSDRALGVRQRRREDVARRDVQVK
jgi:hypothetical protein